ncbi:MAG: orotate phosphoribosyltransferase [Candidatus Omnitrophica bacterium]|nr:orotate phosphoribosyltransferase [Candidatus Omnitrophota bacterium]MDD5436559.1 orotate phosphoribosyltransferase [Candidatus Omnitrophota bacterium]
MTEKEVLDLFHERRALLTGHFKLSSGLHSENYLQCALILQHPDLAEEMAKDIAKQFEKEKIDLVIGPALGGVTLAYEVARALKVRGLFTERQEGAMVLRRGFVINPGERALVIEDVITTGGSTKEVIDVVKKAGGIVVGVASVIDRSSEPVDFGVPFVSLARINVKTYQEEDCPLCRSNIPVTKPGSRK